MAVNHSSMDQRNVEILREFYDDDQIVEIACVAGMFSYLNRVAEVLGARPTLPGEGGPEDKVG